MDKYFSEKLIYAIALVYAWHFTFPSTLSWLVMVWLHSFGLGLIPLIYGAVYKYHEANNIELSEKTEQNTHIAIILIGLLGAIALWGYDHNMRMEYYY